MTNILELRAELRKLGPADLLTMASNQKEHNCVLNPNGPCEFYFKYKGFGFCVSELSGQGCQAEKAQEGKIQKPLDFCEKSGPSADLSASYQGETFTIARAEAKNGNGKVLDVGEADPFCNRIWKFQYLREGSQ